MPGDFLDGLRRDAGGRLVRPYRVQVLKNRYLPEVVVCGSACEAGERACSAKTPQEYEARVVTGYGEEITVSINPPPPSAEELAVQAAFQRLAEVSRQAGQFVHGMEVRNGILVRADNPNPARQLNLRPNGETELQALQRQGGHVSDKRVDAGVTGSGWCSVCRRTHGWQGLQNPCEEDGIPHHGPRANPPKGGSGVRPAPLAMPRPGPGKKVSQ